MNIMGLLFHLVLICGTAVVAYGSLRCLYAILFNKVIGGPAAMLYLVFFPGGVLVALGTIVLTGALVYQFYYKSRNICPDCDGKTELKNRSELVQCEKCKGTGTFRAWKQTIDNSDPDKIQTPWWT